MNKFRLIALSIILIVVTFGVYKYYNTPENNLIPSYSKDFCSSIHLQTDSTSLTKELKKFENIMTEKTGVYVLEDGGNSLISRAWLSENAEKTIDIQYFIFSTDNVGLLACDYLVRAADRGVKIRILIDDIMVEATGKEILALDSHENISIKIYNPGVNLGKNIVQKLYKYTTDFKSANQRMHNKTFIVDNKVSITGGRNIADEYFDYDHEYNFRDRDVLLIGKINNELSKSFNAFWNSTLSEPINDFVKSTKIEKSNFEVLHQYACNPENFWPQVRERIKSLPIAFKNIESTGQLVWVDSIEFVSDIPGKNNSTKLDGGGKTTDKLIDLINNAKTSINIQSPYLITTSIGEKVFKDAIDRGVKIRILTNSLASTDNLEAFSGYQKVREKLLKIGVQIFEFKPDAKSRYRIMTGALQQKLNFTPIFGLHAKSMVVDGKITVIGTFNLDPRSANLNTECITIINSKAISAGVLNGMNEDFESENSWETTLQFNPDSEVKLSKRIKTLTRKVVPKAIL